MFAVFSWTLFYFITLILMDKVGGGSLDDKIGINGRTWPEIEIAYKRVVCSKLEQIDVHVCNNMVLVLLSSNTVLYFLFCPSG